jgi:Cu+-exporting ATPase
MAPHDEKSLIRMAAAIERGSEHPLASAILAAARERGIFPPPARDFLAAPGRGVSGIVEGKSVSLGNAITNSDAGANAEALRRSGHTVVFVTVDGALAGILGISDPIRASTPAALRALAREGIRIVMATGDHATTAQAVATALEIKEVHAELLPHQKLELVRQFKKAGARVAMAGDGINDAPALAAADVGIAMGTGTDVAMESAGVTLIQGDLRSIAHARILSRATLRNIRQNLFFAFFYNALGVPIAAGVLYPLFGTLLTPMIAAAAMSLSSVSVITNALRLRRLKLTVDSRVR